MSDKRIDGIYVPLKVGDIIYTGRFRNKKTTVKTIAHDEYGMPTVNGKRALTFRILPKDKKWKEFLLRVRNVVCLLFNYI